VVLLQLPVDVAVDVHLRQLSYNHNHARQDVVEHQQPHQDVARQQPRQLVAVKQQQQLHVKNQNLNLAKNQNPNQCMEVGDHGQWVHALLPVGVELKSTHVPATIQHQQMEELIVLVNQRRLSLVVIHLVLCMEVGDHGQWVHALLPVGVELKSTHVPATIQHQQMEERIVLVNQRRQCLVVMLLAQPHLDQNPVRLYHNLVKLNHNLVKQNLNLVKQNLNHAKLHHNLVKQNHNRAKLHHNLVRLDAGQPLPLAADVEELRLLEDVEQPLPLAADVELHLNHNQSMEDSAHGEHTEHVRRFAVEV